MKKIAVISLGGSLIVPKAGIDVQFLRRFRSFVFAHARNGWRFVIITGGGSICRHYQAVLRSVGVKDHIAHDWIGIYTTRTNAQLLRLLFGTRAAQDVMTKPKDVHTGLFKKYAVIVAGGEKPGQTTDHVAVECAVRVGAERIVNLSNVDYIYTQDPKKYRGATKLHTLSWTAFQKLFPRRHMPGAHVPFDPVATRLARAHGLTVAFLGPKLSNVKKFLEEKKANGTIVS